MPTLSKTGQERLATCHPDLQRLMNEAIKFVDFVVVFGHRTIAEQQELYAQGRTKPGSIVTDKDGVKNKSMHNHSPSLAIDIAPFNDKTAPIDWSDTHRFSVLWGRVQQIAAQMGIKVRWGCDWDGDGKISEEKFKDFPHIELVV